MHTHRDSCNIYKSFQTCLDGRTGGSGRLGRVLHHAFYPYPRKLERWQAVAGKLSGVGLLTKPAGSS